MDVELPQGSESFKIGPRLQAEAPRDLEDLKCRACLDWLKIDECRASLKGQGPEVFEGADGADLLRCPRAESELLKLGGQGWQLHEVCIQVQDPQPRAGGQGTQTCWSSGGPFAFLNEHELDEEFCKNGQHLGEQVGRQLAVPILR